MTIDSTIERHCETLGLRTDASQDAIRTAYKQLALQWHPDRNRNDKEHAQQKFIEIKEAYIALLEKPRSHPGGKLHKSKAASPPPSSNTAPSSTPSECGSNFNVSPPPPSSAPKQRAKPRRRGARGQSTPPAPTASTSYSSCSQSESDPMLYQDDLSYLKIELDDSAESSYQERKQKSADLEDNDYDFVDFIDLSAPLTPLRIPADSVSKDWIFPLALDLEDLYHGIMQHYRITRTLNSGKTQVVKIDIRVSPSWRTGTRLRIPCAGNQRRDHSFQDIVFIVKEIPHPRFTRVGNDLILSVNVPWVSSPSRRYADIPPVSRAGHKPLQDQEVYVRAFNGEEFALPIPHSLAESADGMRIVGAGMPVEKSGKSIGKGDLLVKWVFAFSDASKARKPSPWINFRKAMVWRT